MQGGTACRSGASGAARTSAGSRPTPPSVTEHRPQSTGTPTPLCSTLRCAGVLVCVILRVMFADCCFHVDSMQRWPCTRPCSAQHNKVQHLKTVVHWLCVQSMHLCSALLMADLVSGRAWITCAGALPDGHQGHCEARHRWPHHSCQYRHRHHCQVRAWASSVP